MDEITPDKQSIGYKSSPMDFNFTNHEFEIKESDTFYLLSDGLISQNGGDRDFPFGKNRLMKILSNYGLQNLQQQKELILSLFSDYKKMEPQRDDITVIGFRV